MSRVAFLIALSLVVELPLVGCHSEPPPLDTITELLTLHDLAGRQPADRPAAVRDREVDREALSRLFTDLDAEERFLTDLYVGFVVGALAREQSRLAVGSPAGGRVVVRAGGLDVVLRLVDGRWRIVLGETIPPAIREQARAERERYEAARTAGAAATRR